MTIISPGFVRTNFAEGVTKPEVKAQLRMGNFAKQTPNPEWFGAVQRQASNAQPTFVPQARDYGATGEQDSRCGDEKAR